MDGTRAPKQDGSLYTCFFRRKRGWRSCIEPIGVRKGGGTRVREMRCQRMDHQQNRRVTSTVWLLMIILVLSSLSIADSFSAVIGRSIKVRRERSALSLRLAASNQDERSNDDTNRGSEKAPPQPKQRKPARHKSPGKRQQPQRRPSQATRRDSSKTKYNPRRRKNGQVDRKYKTKTKLNSRSTKDSGSPSNTTSSLPFTSLLPPISNGSSTSEVTESPTLPFWEQFLESFNATPSDQQGRTRKESIEQLFPAKSRQIGSGGDSLPLQQQQQQEAPTTVTTPIDGVLPVAELFYRSTTATTDDDDMLSNTTTKETVVGADDEELPFSTQESDGIVVGDNEKKINDNSKVKNGGGKKKTQRRIVRRGMEMMVGGVPINADPPMRSLQLHYYGQHEDWASIIGLNTNEFGPLVYTKTAAQVPAVERGLFCEYFCSYADKWDVCPDDLKAIVDSYSGSSGASAASKNNATSNSTQYEMTEREDVFDIEGEFSMDMAIPTQDFLACENEDFEIFRDVLRQAFRTVLTEAADSARDESDDFMIEIPTLSVVDASYGYSHMNAAVKVAAGFDERGTKLYRRVKQISAAFVKAMDDGEIAVAIAETARNETRWPEDLRQRLAEDCLFGDIEDSDDVDDEDVLSIPEMPAIITPVAEELLVGKSDLRRQRELYHGGGTDGVFPDYSSANMLAAPYQGQLGLRLVDAVVERAKARQPRVIAIGDVHGCIDELQELLKLCDYRPGDKVVFLGDLVCKGPDSLSVVQMAREIGAIGVRGNHDFEVVRWHQAILAGIERPVFGSEHFYIATCLSKADLKWLYSLPWFISSSSLDALFVHAGFVAGIRLKKQNPRLMLNMRSILPDGTVTSKHFKNWPWARLWDGPPTVYFGHDADRGLQQWPNAVGLDTGCVYGGRLTAMLLPEGKLVSTPAKRKYFKYRRKHFE